MDQIALIMQGAILLGSFLVWGKLLESRISGIPLIERDPPATRPRPHLAIGLALSWIVFSCVSQYFHSREVQKAVQATHAEAMLILQFNLGLQFVTSCLLIVSLTSLGRVRLTRYGIDGRHSLREIVYGIVGYLLAVIPCIAVNAAMFAFRTDDNQHPFLQILRDQQSFPLVSLLFASAVVMAPIEEELLYRVVLQGTLQRFLSPTASILISSTVFAAVHGFPDAVGLLPLALTLGYFYWRTGSYLTIITIHAVFNGVSVLMTLLCPTC